MKHKNSSGFTFIELMIVVVIIGVLASIAMSNYGDYVLTANRTDARSALSETATSLEKCRSLYSSYNHANCNITFPVNSQNGYYSITAAFATPTTFVLTAAPVGAPQSNDTECGSLTLSNTGLTGATGTTPAECW